MYVELHVLKGHKDSVQCLRFSPDGSLLVSGAADSSARIWNVLTGQLKHTIEADDDIHSIDFSEDGAILALGAANGVVYLVNVSNGTIESSLSGHTNWINQVQFSPDGTTLASVATDDTINVWRVSDEQLLCTVEAKTIHGGLYYASDGSKITAANSDNLITFETATGNIVKKVKWGLFASGAVFSPDRSLLASRFFIEFVTLWLMIPDNGREFLCKLEGHTGVIFSIVFSPDGKLLASGSKDCTVKLWDVSMETLLTTLVGHESIIFSLAISPDNKTLASGSDDRTIRIWNIGT
jgi:WD40 repeat protein